MRDRRLFILRSAILLIGSFGLVTEAWAPLAWKGFSDLCFEGTFKGGPVTNGALTITLKDLEIQGRCFNTQAGESCQPGGGNFGDTTVVVPASSDPDKEKGIISADGCIPLDKWDHHSIPGHQHICLPSSNLNKIEREDSAHITKINTEYTLTNGDRVLRRGFQTCFWDGTFDPETCSPTHGTTFTCPIDEEFRK